MERVPTKWAAKAKFLRDDAIPPETGNKIDIINLNSFEGDIQTHFTSTNVAALKLFHTDLFNDLSPCKYLLSLNYPSSMQIKLPSSLLFSNVETSFVWVPSRKPSLCKTFGEIKAIVFTYVICYNSNNLEIKGMYTFKQFHFRSWNLSMYFTEYMTRQAKSK